MTGPVDLVARALQEGAAGPPSPTTRHPAAMLRGRPDAALDKQWSFGFVLTVCALLLCIPSPAATLIVDQQSPAASDEGAGTEAKPLKTISAAAAKVQPGDTIQVKDGVYREFVSLPDGQEEGRITLEAFPEHSPTIKGSEVVPGPWKPVTTLDGPVFTAPWETYSSIVFCDEEPLKQIGIQGYPGRLERTDFKWQKSYDGEGPKDLRAGTFFYDKDAKLMYVWLADGGDPAKHVVEAGVRYQGVQIGGHTTLRGFTVSQVQDGDREGHMGIRGFGKSILVEDCRALYNEFFGMTIGGEDCIIRNCEMAYSGNNGFSCGSGKRMLFEGNELHDNTRRGDVMCLHSGGLKIVMWEDSRFVRNYVHDEGTHTGLWFDINVRNCLIAENRIENCGVGIYFEISRWGVIANNIIRNCGRGIWSYSSDVLIANNIIDSCGEGITLTGNPRHLNWVSTDPADRRSPNVASSVRNNLIVNNILIDCPGSYIAMTRDTPHCFANFSDYNVFAWSFPAVHKGGNHIKFMAGWDDYYGRIHFWHNERHFDLNSTIADPTLYGYIQQGVGWPQISKSKVVGDVAFMGRAAGNYRLAPDSPVSQAGITVPGKLASMTDSTGRPWELTRIEDAPDPANAVALVELGTFKHYRMQPEPAPLSLFDLNWQDPAAPGLNASWINTGAYPQFDIKRREAGQVTVWHTPMPLDNLLQDADFSGQSENGKLIGAWEKIRGNTLAWDKVAYVHLHDYAKSGLARQRIGTIRPGATYVLTGQMTVRSGLPEVDLTGEMYLAAGEKMEPVGEVAKALARSEASVGWKTYAVSYTAGKPGEDAHVGQELYVVLSGSADGPGICYNEGAPNGTASWDNLYLMSSAR